MWNNFKHNLNLFSMKNLYEILTNQMIEILESGLTDSKNWEKPWLVSDDSRLGAHNAANKHQYSILNGLYLSYLCREKNYPLNRWLSFKQISTLGGKVKKDEKASMVVFSKNLIFSENAGKEEETTIRKFFLRYYNVFNVSQTEGLPSKFYEPYTKEININTVEMGENILTASKANIKHLAIDEAYYSPAKDEICLPLTNHFISTEHFYNTAFHELCHWSGNENRLNRQLFNKFASPEYAREELTAEMGAVYLCSFIGLDIQIINSAQYIHSWLKLLKEDKTAFPKAAMQAQTAANYILTLAGLKTIQEESEISTVQEAV